MHKRSVATPLWNLWINQSIHPQEITYTIHRKKIAISKLTAIFPHIHSPYYYFFYVLYK